MKTVDFALLGDVALHGLFCSEQEKNTSRFTGVQQLLQERDIVFANLETPLEGSGEINELKQGKKGVILCSKKEVYDAVLPLLNIDVVSLANNHIYDCKAEGIRNTIDCLENLGIKFTGGGYKAEHLEPVIIEKNGLTIGFTAYVHDSTNHMVPQDAGVFVNRYDEEIIIDQIKELKKICDCLILSLHWGVDYSYYPTLLQRKAGARFAEAGVDILMGHHAHTVQPFDIKDDSFLFYGLGSFCFGDRVYEGRLRSLKRKTKKTILPIMELKKKDQQVKLEMRDCVSLKELIGNFVTTKIIGLGPVLRFRRGLMKLKHKSKLVDVAIRVKESFLDRVVEYFFGYYRNPFSQLFAVSNFKKLKYLTRDFKSKK
ncbi:MAG: CapA family protein [bacterium]|nr:CapA family protein [bacterium]